MAITLSIDNDRLTNAVDFLRLDESQSEQTTATTDTGNDIPLLVTAGALSGFQAPFNAFLNGLIMGSFTLSAAQKNFAAAIGGASSSSDFVNVVTTADEQITNLFFSDSDGAALNGDKVIGMKTLDNLDVYLWSAGDYCIATTSSVEGEGRVVAAFYLNEDQTTHKTAQVQMATFEALQHDDPNATDEPANFTDMLRVSATGSLSFKFDTLESGSFLWAAVGSGTSGLLVTGQDLNVNDTPSKRGDIVKGGGDASDSVNTSQGGIGATIGINSQHFADSSGTGGTRVNGPVGVFTMVRNFVPLANAAQATGINVNQIDYSDYINAPSAKIFLSQVTGSSSLGAAMRISLFEAGGGNNSDHATSDLKPEEGYADTASSYSYIGDQDSDSHLTDDTPVAVASVTVKRGATTHTWVLAESGQTKGGNIVVTIVGHDIVVTGLQTADTVGFVALDLNNSNVDGTFNRFHVQALAGTNAFDIGRIDLDEGVRVDTGIGGKLIVEDDAPVVTLDLAAGAEVRVDESLGANAGEDETVSLGQVTVAGALLFDTTAAFGTDDEGSDASDYSLDIIGVAPDSGLDDTESGQNVLLYFDGDDVVGRTASSGLLVFRIAIDEDDGSITLTQYRAMKHGDNGDLDEADTPLSILANRVAAVRTITDGDQDQDSDSADIGPALKFEDDGPSVTLDLKNGAEVRVDESLGANAGENELASLGQVTVAAAVLFDKVDAFGTDKEGASGSGYSLKLASAGADSLLDDTASGQNVLLYKVDNDIVGRTATSNLDVFRIAINATTGAVTLTQYRAMKHGDAGDPDEADTPLSLAEGLVAAVRTITDGDGDSDDDEADIGPAIKFEDDGPSIGEISDGLVDLALNDSVTNSLNGAVGSDAKASPYSLTSFTPSVTVGTVEVQGVADGTTGVTYWANSNNNLVFGDEGDTAYYRLTLDQADNSGAGSYTFTVLVPPPPSFTEFDFTDLPSGQNMFGLLVDYDEVGKQDLDGTGLFVIGRDANMNAAGAFQTSQALNSETINTSKGGGGVTIGVENQMFDAGEGAVFVFLDNPDDKAIAPHNVTPSVGPVGGLTQNSADDGDTVGFKDTKMSRGAEIDVVQKQGSDALSMKISAYNVVLPNTAGDGIPIVSANDPLGANPPNTDDRSDDSRAFCDNPLAGAGAVSVTSVQVINRATGEVLESVVNVNGVAVNVDDGTGPGYDLDSAAEDAAGIVVTFTQIGLTGKYTATVTGFGANQTIAYGTAEDHDAALVECVSGKWDVGGFSLREGHDTPDQKFDFTAQVIDGDGDTDSASWSIGVDGTGAFDDDAVGGVSPNSLLTVEATMRLFEDRDLAALSSHLHQDMLAM